MSLLYSQVSQPSELHVFIHLPFVGGEKFYQENKRQGILDNSTSLEICIQG